jgi:hypothetical protein
LLADLAPLFKGENFSQTDLLIASADRALTRICVARFSRSGHCGFSARSQWVQMLSCSCASGDAGLLWQALVSRWQA